MSDPSQYPGSGPADGWDKPPPYPEANPYWNLPPDQSYGQYPGGYPQGNWQPGGWGGPPKRSGLAIASLVCGIGIVLFGVFAGIPAVITGVMARNRIRMSQGAETGNGMALAGIILGSLSILVTIVVLFGVAVGKAHVSGSPT